MTPLLETFFINEGLLFQHERIFNFTFERCETTEKFNELYDFFMIAQWIIEMTLDADD